MKTKGNTASEMTQIYWTSRLRGWSRAPARCNTRPCSTAGWARTIWPYQQ